MQFYRNLVFAIGATILLFGPASTKMKFEDVKNGVKMDCDQPIKFGNEYSDSNTLVATDQSKMEYTCGSDDTFVYVNMGKTFVSLDIAGLSGFIFASVASTIFIAIAVYSLTVQNKPRTYQTSDRHPLVHNDGNEAVYSHLNNDGKATYSQLAKKRFQ
ncbi:uncharacterized protein LOC116991245 isoform X3 [Amblyraja radiata]|uniref:uncharacterized protein LOC116991245 isoform X3 n=1 Tax=Amblyraja radiata TaxID=386614 RepID=UPI0014040054|nr:uncharacterized protein LOC116991245 isoform X3 [Amblyraja radiata]